MNLFDIAGPVVAAVNPWQVVSVQVSTGYSTNPDGSRPPAYAVVSGVQAQVQELSSSDLRQLDALNIQGATRMLYVDGRLDGVVRMSAKGGDMVTLSDGTVWLTTRAIEAWDTGWCKVALTLQDGR